MNPDCHEAFGGWGNALLEKALNKTGEEADDLFAQAGEKYRKAVEIKPDDFMALDNWGSSLLFRAKIQTGSDADTLIQQAQKKCLAAEKVKRGAGAYNLACIAALHDEKEQCRDWLQIGEEEGTLPTREHAETDDDLAYIREEDWFQQIRWQGEKHG